MTYIGNTIEGVVFALLSRLSDQREKIGKHYFPLIALISVLTMFFSAYAFFFSKEIVVLLLGAQWGDSAVILKWIAIVIFIQTFSRFSDTLVRATNEFPASAKIKFIYLISIVIFIIIGNALAGINGVLVGIILANLLHSVLMLRLGLKITSFAYKGLLWMLLRVLVLAAVVVAKGLYLAHISPNIAVQLALSMISDCLLLVIFISSPRLAGRLISEFVVNRISEIPWLSKIQLGRNL
jgi:PST family polysaccharide transporter